MHRAAASTRGAEDRDALERRVRALERASERADERVVALAKLVKTFRDDGIRDRQALREAIEGARRDVDDVRERMGARAGEGGGKGGGGGGENLESAAREAEARAEERRALTASVEAALAAFETRVDARIDRLAALVAEASAARAEDSARWREALEREREARRETRRVDVARENGRAREFRRERLDDGARDEARETVEMDGEVDENAEDASPSARAKPELEARRRRLRALYRELQEISF